MSKLKNKYIGPEEGLRLQDPQGNDLGALTVAFISDMTKENVKIGPFTAMGHLLREAYIQRHSYLQEHQRLPPRDAKEVLENPKEKFYTHVVAEADGKGAAFDVVDRGKFSDGESYVKMFYIPTILTSEKRNYTNTFVATPNGKREPLEQLVLKLSLEHVDGKNLLTVFDAPETELPQLEPYKFRALSPKFDVPSISAKTSREFSQVADQVYIVVRAPEGTKAEQYQHGVELNKAFELFNGYLRESYIDEYANVRDSKEFKLRRIETAMTIYFDGIKKLVDSAVKVGDKVIVPYKAVTIPGATPLSQEDKKRLIMQYTELGKEAVKQYKRYFPAGKK